MSKSKELNCQAPQCGYWREENGYSIDADANNGMEICKKGEARYEHQIFVVVNGGNVSCIYSDNYDIAVEVFDYDNARHDSENENALEEMRARVEVIENKYHQIY